MLETLLHYDQQVFYYINRTLANKPLDIIIPLINNEKIWLIPAVVLVATVLVRGGKKARMVFLGVLIAVLATDFICFRLLKPAIGRKRPSHALADARVLEGRRSTMGFPSNHAANVAAAATFLAYYYRRLVIPGVVIAAAVAFARVYAGVHYPLDVVCGAAIGAAVSLLLIWIKHKVRPAAGETVH